MRLVVCLVFLASFALVCQGEAYRGGYTGPIPRPSEEGLFRPIRSIDRPLRPGHVCTLCSYVSIRTAEYCCDSHDRCCYRLNS
nr:penaeidin-2b-like [Penaeus vannamei]